MSKLIRFVLYSIYMALTGSGAVFMIAGLKAASPWAGLGMMLLASMIGYAVSGYVKNRTALAAIAASILMAAATVMLLPYEGWNVILALVNVAGIIYGARHKWEDVDSRLIDVHLLPVGLMVCAIGYFAAFINICDAAQTQIGYTMYVYICITVLLVNRRSVQVNAGGQARRMMHGNQVLAWSFVGIFTLGVFFGPLQEAVGTLLRKAISAFFGLFKGQATMQQVTTGGGGGGGMDLSALGGVEREWPAWLKFLGDVVIYVVTAAALIGLAALVIWGLIRAFRELSVFLKDWLANFGSSGNDDFSEESEQLMSAQSMRDQFREDLTRRVKKLFERPVRWNALTPNERVRYVYKKILQQEKKISASAENLTPHQLCERSDKDARYAVLYGRVRYGDQDASAQEAENWREYLKG